MLIISGKMYDSDDSACKKFDKAKKESADGINLITIDSNVNVKVSACDTNEITAHLHGSAIMNSDLELSLTKCSNEIQISVKTDGISNSCNNMSIMSKNSTVVINNFCNGSNGGLILDVRIPAKIFEEISVKSKSANIDISSSVNGNIITVESKHGNVNVSAAFQDLTINCKHGNVSVDSEACYNVKLNVTSKHGNVNVTIGNIGTSTVSMNSKYGKCKNSPNLRGIYTVSGYITSKYGNAKFH